MAAGLPGSQCLAAEYETPCNPAGDAAVCAWHNAAVQDCDVYSAAPLAQQPEDVWYMNATSGVLRWAGDPQASAAAAPWGAQFQHEHLLETTRLGVLEP